MNDLPRPAAFESLESRDLVALFNWLSAVFATPPDRASIASYRHGPAAAWLESVASLPGCAEAVERMRCALEADAEDALVAAQVGSAYGILFEGIGGPRTVSPYESVHADGGRLFGAPAAAMEAILAAHDSVGGRLRSRGARPHRRRTRRGRAVAGGRRTGRRRRSSRACEAGFPPLRLAAPPRTPTDSGRAQPPFSLRLSDWRRVSPPTPKFRDATKH
jgi:hypothetical protein